MSKQVIGGVIFDVDDVTSQARVFEGPFGQLVKDVAGDTQPTPDTLALRTSDGRVKAADAVEDDDAVNLGLANAAYVAKSAIENQSPLDQIVQLPSGRVMLYVSVAESVLITLDAFGIKQMQDPTNQAPRSVAVTDKTMPSGMAAGTAAGAAKIVKFQGLYYLQTLVSGVPTLFSASPVANPTAFTWSSSLRTLGAGSLIIGTGLAADSNYLYWVTYGDPIGGPELHRFDGTTWTVTALSSYFARHVHGVFPDPNNPGHVYLTGGDAGSASRVLKSTDYGVTWTAIINDAGWQAVQLSFSPTHVWAASDSSANFVAYTFDRTTPAPSWRATRAHRIMPVPQGLAPRRVTDCATTAASATITSATGAFTSADVGSPIRMIGQDSVPIDTYIASVTNSTTAVLSKVALDTASGRTVIFGGSAWGAMAYYGAVDPATDIYYFVTINGAVGGNVDGLFAVLPNGEVTLLGILTTSPDGTGITIDGGYLWVNGFHRSLLSI